jgi:hypothetical protein
MELANRNAERERNEISRGWIPASSPHPVGGRKEGRKEGGRRRRM